MSLVDNLKTILSRKAQDDQGWIRQGKFTPKKNLRDMASDSEGWIRQGKFTPGKQITPVAQSVGTSLSNYGQGVQQRWNEAGGVVGLSPVGAMKSWTQNVNTQLPQNFSQDVANFVRNKLANTNPVGQFFGNVAANTVQTSATGAQNFAKSYQDLFYNKDGNKNVAENAVKLAYNTAKTAAPFVSTIFNAANAVASVPRSNYTDKDGVRRIAAGIIKGVSGEKLAPNVPDVKTNLGILGEHDLIKGLGSMYGFTQNPLNKAVFGNTQIINQAKWLTNPVTNYLVTRSFKGGVEGLLQGLGEMPSDISEADKAKFVTENILSGMGSELVMDILGQQATKGFKRVWDNPQTQKTLAQTYDYIRDARGRFTHQIDKARFVGLTDKGVAWIKNYEAKYNVPESPLNPKPRPTAEEMNIYKQLLSIVEKNKLEQQSGKIDFNAKIESPNGKTSPSSKSFQEDSLLPELGQKPQELNNPQQSIPQSTKGVGGEGVTPLEQINKIYTDLKAGKYQGDDFNRAQQELSTIKNTYGIPLDTTSKTDYSKFFSPSKGVGTNVKVTKSNEGLVGKNRLDTEPVGKPQVSTIRVSTPQQAPVKIKGTKLKASPNQSSPSSDSIIPPNDKPFTKLGEVEEKIYGLATPQGVEIQKGNKSGAGFISNKLREGQSFASEKIGDLVQHENPIVRNIARLMQGFSGGLGKSESDVVRKGQLQGGIEYSTKLASDTQDYVYGLVNKNESSLKKIHSFLDPELSKEKVDFNSLSDNEKEAVSVLRLVSDFINDTNYKNGFISKEQWQSNQGGKYIARAYEPFDYPPEVADFIKQSKLKLDLNPFKKREDINDWKEANAIRDPAYLMAKRLQQTMFNDSVRNMSESLLNTPHVSSVAKPGFVQISDSKLYGSLASKYVRKDILEDIRGFFFTHDAAQKAYELISWYDRLGVRRGYKKLMTIFNPAVRLGNKTGNYVFAWLNGINPVTFKKNKMWADKALKTNDPLVRRLTQDGLLGTDITKADIARMSQQIIESVADVKQRNKIIQKLKEIDTKLTEGYSKTDDLAKLSAVKTWLDRGYSYEESLRRVYSGFQNYRMTGWLFDVGAKIPVLGNPFVRFKGDLLRIVKNTAIDHPFRLAGTLVGWKLFTDVMSRMSGESEEDRKTRESRVGAPRIPFTNISLAVQTPYGEVNAARLVGAYSMNSLGGGDAADDLSDFSPIKNPFDKKSYGSDPLIGPLISTGLDTDFRGKSIKDPNADKYFGSDLPVEDQRKNQTKFLIRSYSPTALNSVVDIKDAVQGNPNFYGSQRTPIQAILRAYPGIKVEQYGPKEAEKSRNVGAYYKAADESFAKLRAEEKAAVRSLPDYDPSNPNDKVYKYRTLLQYPAVYNYKREVAIKTAESQGKEVDPLYQFPYQDVKRYMTYQTLPPGSQEKKNFYKTYPVVGEIGEARSSYFKANPIDNEDQKESGLLQYPEQSEYVSKQMDAKNWNDPQVQAWFDAKLAYDNQQRELLGLPPLSDSYGGWPKKPKKASYKKSSPIKIKTPDFKTPNFGKLGTTSFKVVKKPSVKLSTPKKIVISSPKANTIKIASLPALKVVKGGTLG